MLTLLVFFFSPTKACAAAALIFVLDKKTDLISAPHALVYFGVVIFLVYFRLSAMLLGIADPFQPVENLLSALFLGGILDSLQEMFYGKVGASGSSVSGRGK